jgi:hypothetical protein
MPNLHSRLTRLETRLGSPQTPWDVLAASVLRSQARARLKLSHLLAVDPEDPRVIEAAEHLTHDTEAQRRADEALIDAWRQSHPTHEAGDVRAHLLQRLDSMTARLGVHLQGEGGE